MRRVYAVDPTNGTKWSYEFFFGDLLKIALAIVSKLHFLDKQLPIQVVIEMIDEIKPLKISQLDEFLKNLSKVRNLKDSVLQAVKNAKKRLQEKHHQESAKNTSHCFVDCSEKSMSSKSSTMDTDQQWTISEKNSRLQQLELENSTLRHENELFRKENYNLKRKLEAVHLITTSDF